METSQVAYSAWQMYDEGMDIFKVNMVPGARSDFSPLLDGKWHIIDFSTDIPGETPDFRDKDRYPVYSNKITAIRNWAGRNGMATRTRREDAKVCVRVVPKEQRWLEKLAVMDHDSAYRLDEYMIKWDRFRSKTMVLTAPELLALAELLRELDETLREFDVSAWDGYSWEDEGLRAKIETLLGMHPGSLDTSRN